MIWAASGADNDQLRSLLLRDLAGIPERSHYDTLQMSPRPLAPSSFPPGSGQSGPTGQALQSGTSEPLGPDQTDGSRLFCF